MRDPLESIKIYVREMRPYSLRFEPARVKLNQNENPWDLPIEIKQETFRRLQDRAWSRYPEFAPSSLIARLAEFSGWTADGTLVGNGSNELIQALLMVTVAEGRRVLISEPTFALYRQGATLLGAEVLSVPLSQDLTYDVSALKAAAESLKPEVTIICSPNNPTGCTISPRDLISLLEASNGLVVVDEAYFEFAGETAVPLLRQHPNLVVLRTFSKALAMAALRVGYLLTTPELAREISKALLPYNLNFFSQTAAEVAIEMYDAKLKPLVTVILAERDRVFGELKRIPGLEPVSSRANFMVVRSAIEPRRVFEELLQRGILIRDVTGYRMLKDYFRIGVGTPVENDLLLESLREIFAA
jgi:histidinol-phosphate aminotransferase